VRKKKFVFENIYSNKLTKAIPKDPLCFPPGVFQDYEEIRNGKYLREFSIICSYVALGKHS
jgi:hypothetical protein